MKILFFASYPNLPIGYSRIGNIIANYLSESGHNVYYFGISNFKNNSVERFIHPDITVIDGIEEEIKLGTSELYGVNSICDQIKLINPDILFLYNDIIVISRIFNNIAEKKIIKNFKIITYLDLVYPFEKIKLIRHIDNFSDTIVVFSEYWKKNLTDIGVRPNKIKILYHGIDTKMFYPLDRMEAKKYFNFVPDDFVVLNSNRNNYRKCIDKTIDVFVEFLSMKNQDRRIKLFLNMNTNSDDNVTNGYDIINQVETACIKNKLNFQDVVNNHIFVRQSQNNYTDEQLNILYNACDIGINTCVGEGFGLCNLEHGGLGHPQIISNVGGLSDIFGSDYSFPIEPIAQIYVNNQQDYHGGYLEICSNKDFVNALDKYFDNPMLVESHGQKSRNIITNKFNWDNILKELDNIILC